MTFRGDDRLIVQNRFARWPVVQLEELPPAFGGRRPAAAVTNSRKLAGDEVGRRSSIYPPQHVTADARLPMGETFANFTQPEHCADLARKCDAEAELSKAAGRPIGR